MPSLDDSIDFVTFAIIPVYVSEQAGSSRGFRCKHEVGFHACLDGFLACGRSKKEIFCEMDWISADYDAGFVWSGAEQCSNLNKHIRSNARGKHPY